MAVTAAPNCGVVHPYKALVQAAPNKALRQVTAYLLQRRFHAEAREYMYFIAQHGDLDLPAMQTAAEALAGTHDFRNFCKVDPRAGVSNFTRHLHFARVRRVMSGQVLCN